MTRDEIKRLAHLHGVTLKEVAAKMGITEVGLHQSLRAVETGGITLGTLERIAAAIGCNPAEFFGVSPGAAVAACPHCGKPVTVCLQK